MAELFHTMLTIYTQSKTIKNGSHKQCNVEFMSCQLVNDFDKLNKLTFLNFELDRLGFSKAFLSLRTSSKACLSILVLYHCSSMSCVYAHPIAQN
jgi:hypothetical protein